ncbi:unnamed protein product [Penicillium salamii]|nr:unnamed protein product [Penicillium salamii]
MSFIKSLFGNAAAAVAAQEADDQNAVRALPATWYTSEEMYQLERRAIFSKKWLLTTHKLRLPNAGDWLKYDIANFEYIICKDRQGNINAFHNVCRHRAFPIIESEKGDSGNAKLFACKYHGWSYGLNGKLAKAPGYQDLESFDKSKNSLLPIHVHIDDKGFIWVNLDASPNPVPWSNDLGEVDKQERYKHYDWDSYVFDHSYELEGPNNWKLSADNYNECYHCKTTHPDVPDIVDLATYKVDTEKDLIIHYGNSSEEQINNGFRVAAQYFFPNSSINVTQNFFFIQKFVASGPHDTRMIYEIYRNKNATDEAFNEVDTIYKRVMSEDKVLCAAAHKNIQRGAFIAGEMHPKMEKGPLYFQKRVRETMLEHYQKEVAAGKEIWPAQHFPSGNKEVTEVDMQFCGAVDCCKLKESGNAYNNMNDFATEVTLQA